MPSKHQLQVLPLTLCVLFCQHLQLDGCLSWSDDLPPPALGVLVEVRGLLEP